MGKSVRNKCRRFRRNIQQNAARRRNATQRGASGAIDHLHVILADI